MQAGHWGSQEQREGGHQLGQGQGVETKPEKQGEGKTEREVISGGGLENLKKKLAKRGDSEKGKDLYLYLHAETRERHRQRRKQRGQRQD